MGPIEVHSAGNPIRVGGVKQRSILALLIANQGRAVSTDRIVEDVYGEAAGGGIRRSVQSTVSLLRRDLGDVIVGTGDGYLFDAPRLAVDAARFEDGVAAGLETLEIDPERAATLLRDALGLWRGDPYADVDGRAVFESEIVRLCELRLVALEARVDADLGCGRHREVLGELEALTAEFPLRERLWGLWMLALYRAGRQAEALAAYQRLRTMLGEELGIEPSTELRVLEEQILLQDPVVDLVAPVPRDLPAQLMSFDSGQLELPSRQLAAVMFTDMVGFTALMQENEQLGLEKRARYRNVLETQHDTFAGRIVNYYGDGALSVLPNSVDAVLCAVAIQRQLREPLEVPVRIGVHVGDVIVEPTGVIGDAVNIASRIESFGVPGAVLVSDSVYDQTKNQSQLGFVSLGRFRLENVDRPFEILAVSTDGLEVPVPGLLAGKGERIAGPPGLLADSGVPTNLPHRFTKLFGREAEIAAVRDLVAAHRLVTLTGTGGIGKTSLAIRAAAEGVKGFRDGVWLVELAPLTDDLQLPGVIAGLFAVKGRPSQDVTEALVRALAPMETLLILDNCEHLIDGVAKLADTLLGATEHVRVLATSREPLRLSGEALLRVPPLEVPPVGSTIDEVAVVAAVALFIDRARLVRSDFTLDGADGAAVVEICRRLDGIPLAIELAAARLDTMTVSQIADRLDDRFRLLTRGSRAALPRQQTLLGTVEWSHDLLTEPEQTLFRRLGVFGGSFTLEAAQQVGGYGPLEPAEIVDALDHLTETSLVLPPEPGSARYRLLETIRAYARHNLGDHAETEPTMRRLATYVLEAGPATHDGFPLSDFAEWQQWRADEVDNFRSALSWAREAQDGPRCGALAVEFFNYLLSTSLEVEAVAWVTSALDLLADEPTHLRLRLLSLQTGSVIDSGDIIRARRIIETLRTEAERIGEERMAAHAVSLEAEVTLAEGDLEGALSLNTAAAARLLAAGSPLFGSTVLTGIEILNNLGRYQEAEALIARLVSESAHIPGGPVEDWVTAALRGTIAIYRGDYAEALELFESCVEPARRIGTFDLCEVLCQLAVAEFGRGHNDAAHRLIHEAGPLVPELIPIASYVHRVPIIAALIDLHHQGVKAAIPHLRNALDNSKVPRHEAALTVVAESAFEANQPTEAAVILAAAEAARERIPGLVPEDWVRQSRQRSVEHLRQRLNAADLEQLHKEGKKLSYQQAAQRARTLLTMVEESDSAGRPDQSIPEQ